jgi:hypothetical protein
LVSLTVRFKRSQPYSTSNHSVQESQRSTRRGEEEEEEEEEEEGEEEEEETTTRKEEKENKTSTHSLCILLTSTMRKFSTMARWSTSTFSARKKSTEVRTHVT